MIEYKERSLPKYVWQFLNKNMAKLAAALKPYIGAPTSSYKVYSALISQNGTSAPTAQVLENTLGGPVTYDYLNPGSYAIILPSSFSNIWVSLTNNSAGSDGILEYEINGFPTNTIRIQSNEFNTGSPADINLANGVLYLTSIEIRVYN